MKIFETDSLVNGKLTVVRDLAWGTYIKAGGLTQSGGILTGIWKKGLEAVKEKEVKSCLILGLGGGTVARLVRKNWPDSEITGVDIDPVIVELGRKYLRLDSSSTYSIVGDAYDFSKKDKKKYDLVLVDLYLGDKYPEKFEELKFIKNVKKLLNTGGVAIFNRLYGASDRGESMKFGVRLEKVFKKVDYIYPQANVMFVCYNI